MNFTNRFQYKEVLELVNRLPQKERIKLQRELSKPVPAKIKFKKIINVNHVSVVFAGHFHDLFGQYERSDIYGNVPLFLSGALFENNFFLVHFSDDKINVQKYDGVDGTPTISGNPIVIEPESLVSQE